MQCNIDQRGRRVRRMYGWVMLGLALVVALCGAMSWWPGVWAWVTAGVLAASGAFAWWESRKGWCAVRAMGIKTPV